MSERTCRGTVFLKTIAIVVQTVAISSPSRRWAFDSSSRGSGLQLEGLHQPKTMHVGPGIPGGAYILDDIENWNLKAYDSGPKKYKDDQGKFTSRKPEEDRWVTNMRRLFAYHRRKAFKMVQEWELKLASAEISFNRAISEKTTVHDALDWLYLCRKKKADWVREKESQCEKINCLNWAGVILHDKKEAVFLSSQQRYFNRKLDREARCRDHTIGLAEKEWGWTDRPSNSWPEVPWIQGREHGQRVTQNRDASRQSQRAWGYNVWSRTVQRRHKQQASAFCHATKAESGNDDVRTPMYVQASHTVQSYIEEQGGNGDCGAGGGGSAGIAYFTNLDPLYSGLSKETRERLPFFLQFVNESSEQRSGHGNVRVTVVSPEKKCRYVGCRDSCPNSAQSAFNKLMLPEEVPPAATPIFLWPSYCPEPSDSDMPPPTSREAAAKAASAPPKLSPEPEQDAAPPLSRAASAKAAPAQPNWLPVAERGAAPEEHVVDRFTMSAQRSAARATTRASKSLPPRLDIPMQWLNQPKTKRNKEHQPSKELPDLPLREHDRLVTLPSKQALEMTPYLDGDCMLWPDYVKEQQQRHKRNQAIKEALLKGCPVRYRCTDWSLAPRIVSGDVVMLHPVNEAHKEVEVGDIVFYQTPRSELFCCHVVLKKYDRVDHKSSRFHIGNMARYNGDAGGKENGEIDEEHIWGKLLEQSAEHYGSQFA